MSAQPEPARVPAGISAGGQFATQPRAESTASLALHATGVLIRNRETGATHAVHEDCLEALQAQSATAFDPFHGSFAVLGPHVGQLECNYTGCTH
ncbi:hypothetical protein CHO01_38860 [Cellulomonas hominis]|uniref:Uncharacterized protein n=1 Tax=Cellulomonas hominis TaxID=156981 RepID=A0A511FHS0_9CELL|nr:hypothetical protein [Cellulomonas hominis]MBB5474655.1 hypothetical protein [Cellulomonas hominis]NKY05516.1 hypothetical protein [Cellulomonas hominis]GEL48770.1 hypothetical protein CHO01_38860 [Cellulomonas hominis]